MGCGLAVNECGHREELTFAFTFAQRISRGKCVRREDHFTRSTVLINLEIPFELGGSGAFCGYILDVKESDEVFGLLADGFSFCP